MLSRNYIIGGNACVLEHLAAAGILPFYSGDAAAYGERSPERQRHAV